MQSLNLFGCFVHLGGSIQCLLCSSRSQLFKQIFLLVTQLPLFLFTTPPTPVVSLCHCFANKQITWLFNSVNAMNYQVGRSTKSTTLRICFTPPLQKKGRKLVLFCVLFLKLFHKLFGLICNTAEDITTNGQWNEQRNILQE